VTTSFMPKHFPRTRLSSGRVLSDAQQYQYDVLRTVGGKLVKGRDGWYREVPYTDVHEQTGTVREKIHGLNITAMWRLVDFDLAECTDDAVSGGYLFLLPDQAKDVPGRRYVQTGHVIKEKKIS
jgi:hypothetical protein